MKRLLNNAILQGMEGDNYKPTARIKHIFSITYKVFENIKFVIDFNSYCLKSSLNIA